jgi:hypothetical protein
LTEIIYQYCHTDCLLIASVDFSHYLPSFAADIHDVFSLNILQQQNLTDTFLMESDSPKSIYVAMKYSNKKLARNWRLAGHTNLSEFISDVDIESTSHILGYYRRSILPSSDKIEYPRTFTLAKNLDPLSQQKGVGERFFYGIDDLQTGAWKQEPYLIGNRIKIATGTKSNISLSSGNLEVTLATDLAISGVITSDTAWILLLPLDTSTQPEIFLRGTEKKAAINRLLDHSGLSPDSVNLGTGWIKFPLL